MFTYFCPSAPAEAFLGLRVCFCKNLKNVDFYVKLLMEEVSETGLCSFQTTAEFPSVIIASLHNRPLLTQGSLKDTDGLWLLYAAQTNKNTTRIWIHENPQRRLE